LGEQDEIKDNITAEFNKRGRKCVLYMLLDMKLWWTTPNTPLKVWLS